MSKVVISVRDHRRFIYKANDEKLFLFSEFLKRDVGCGKYSHPERLKNLVDEADLEEEINYGESTLEKEGDVIEITTWFYEGIQFDISPENFKLALDGWKDICPQNYKEIIITQDESGAVSFRGNNDIVKDAIITLWEGKYQYPKSVDPTLYHLSFFLLHEFETEGLSRDYIVNEWLDDPNTQELSDGWLFVKKMGDNVSLFRNPGKANPDFAFVTNKEELKKIYKQFKEVSASRPKFIFLIRDGEKINVEGRDQEV